MKLNFTGSLLPKTKALFTQILLVMRLTFLLVLIACLQASGHVYAQNITYSKQQASLEEVFKVIRKQTGYEFLYNSASLRQAKKLDLKFYRTPINTALDDMFRNQDLTYTIIGRTIVVKEKKPSQEPLPVAQPVPIKVTGTVVDLVTGKPLPGASIQIKGSTAGTNTDQEGRFSLSVQEDAVLIVSYLGYAKLEIPVNGRNEINIRLQPAATGLDQFVVIGYGIQKKSDLTGAVGQVKYDDIKNLPLVSVEQALQGQVSGVKVKRNAGDPSGNFGISIRGVNSTSNAGQPLYVVDGIPLAAGSLIDINPNDIESLDVLKDASASAIYGARAANGVVIITTKMGSRRDKDIVDVSGETGLQTPVLPFQMADAFLQAQIVKEALTEQGISIPTELNDHDWLAKNNHNWQKLATRNGLFQKYNISLSGGAEKTQYLLSAYYSNTQGVLINSGFKTGGFRINMDREINERLKVGVRLSGGIDGGNNAPTTGYWSIWKQTLMFMPWTEYKDADGNFLPMSTTGVQAANSFDNPIAEMEQNVIEQHNSSVVGNTYLEYKIAKGLKFKYLFGGEMHTGRAYSFYPIYDRGAFKRTTTSVQDAQVKNSNWVSDATLSYDREFKDLHKISVLAGFSAQRFDSRSLSVNGSGALNNQINQISGQPIITSSGGIVENGLLSYFARAFYSFKEKYLLTATIRRDGSSRFSPNQKWGTFPSASVGWNMDKESFMENVGFVSNLKWRVSYGLTGNQDIPAFRYVPLVSTNNYAFGNALATGYAINNPANPFLQWESLKQFDAGLDISLFKRRITATFDYFIKTSNNLLTNTVLAPTAGYSGTLTKNIGIIENRGFETEITSINTTGAFKWTTSLNFAFVKNNVVNLGLDVNGNPQKYQGGSSNGFANLTTQGHPIASFYGYIFDGIYQLGEESKALSVDSKLRPGDVKYRDLNGDGKITEADRDFIGSPNPTFFGGISNTVGYKNFTLSVFADFAKGAKVLNTQRMLGESGYWFQGQMDYMKDRWTAQNPGNKYPRASMSTGGYNTMISTHFVENADFLRINNLALTYSFPKSLLDLIKVQAFRLSLIANNLYTFTGYTGYTPEASSYGNDPLSAGLDMGTYPLTRMYSVKVNITF